MGNTAPAPRTSKVLLGVFSLLMVLGLIAAVFVTRGEASAQAGAGSVETGSMTPIKSTPESVRSVVNSADDITICVLGDSTGDEYGEWVDLWAKSLAASATVKLRMWDGDKVRYRPGARVYGNADRVITIWNGSKGGSSADYPLQRLATIQPAQPDLVVFNYGHNFSPNGVIADEQTLSRALDKYWDADLLTLRISQNPGYGNWKVISTAASQDVLAWSQAHGAAVVNVNKAFRKAPGTVRSLLMDDVHPNARGNRVFADAVIGFFDEPSV
ncbi:SGNH/GDSL hydrolase family protein [Saxibacter everestensis]|uniref:SGNH/GDSL hydrolase family protein n=1 Tax=Saxibacter everestensis TaxID=2909229 RepID=A0ABY8QV17_9MICO|nr:SGNH/GDSL hydrolase family protein [Brevibacteriaceae bacterium ZFBP1038]